MAAFYLIIILSSLHSSHDSASIVHFIQMVDSYLEREKVFLKNWQFFYYAGLRVKSCTRSLKNLLMFIHQKYFEIENYLLPKFVLCMHKYTALQWECLAGLILLSQK